MNEREAALRTVSISSCRFLASTAIAFGVCERKECLARLTFQSYQSVCSPVPTTWRPPNSDPAPRPVHTCSLGDLLDLSKLAHYVIHTSIGKWSVGLRLKGLLVLHKNPPVLYIT